jgi:N-methylhydantoinase B
LTSDGLILEVARHSLTYISEEMGIALRRSAYSPNIRERADHSCAVLDSKGKTIGQAEHIPVHIGSFSLGLKSTLEFLDDEQIETNPGDMFIVNDPYISGTHLNDVTLIRPVFLDQRMVGYTANKAHHVDVGGKSPASINPLAKRLDDEGIVITPTKLMQKNILRNDVVETLSGQVRMPEMTLGDLRAQVAANILGERRLLELVTKIGLDAFSNACDAILDQTYRLALAQYAKMPKGAWKGEDWVELNDDLLAIRELVTMRENGVVANFTGTTRQVEAPLNAVLGVTTAAVTFAVRTVMPEEMPLNDGFNRTIRIIAPEGTIVNPTKPAPVAGGNLETSQRIVDTTYRALSQAIPYRIPAASHGSMNNLMMGGTHPRTGKTWAFYETIGGGYGGRPGADGVDAVQVNMTNTLNTPIEVMEHYYPVRFKEYKIRDLSGGFGQWRGGMGIERTFTAQERISITVLGDRNRIRPSGLAGGLPGEASEYFVIKADGQQISLKSKDTAQLEPGDTAIIRTAGGGGYGDPRKRKPSLIMKDIENQYITHEKARSVYAIG